MIFIPICMRTPELNFFAFSREKKQRKFHFFSEKIYTNRKHFKKIGSEGSNLSAVDAIFYGRFEKKIDFFSIKASIILPSIYR